ncbi:very-long-chain (3R)-3-hydroxyacyl-CoA dehydratase 4 isoform X3 [Rattus norvegicus]|uniref:very-long-chain (3R)-3-hydroxyacyl-CoA dehydratase 4 isoform X3 n=1 Tax=Rattus norvegicus TaxID=10116 RepID=UPI002FD7C32D
MGPSVLPAWLQPRYRKSAYLFIYYLIQFCGHSWILTNMTVRFFSFGKDSMVDTFYAIGLVMRVCQSISLLELLHIYIGIESNQLFPKFLQVHLQHAVSHRDILCCLDMAQSNTMDANLPSVCSC